MGLCIWYWFGVLFGLFFVMVGVQVDILCVVIFDWVFYVGFDLLGKGFVSCIFDEVLVFDGYCVELVFLFW